MSERMALNGFIDRMVNIAWPALAKERGYPVYFNHCFRRIIYDNACGEQWQNVIANKFKDRAPLELLQSVEKVILKIENGDLSMHEANRRSLKWRGKI